MNKERYDKIIDECRDLVISRNEQYGDTVDVVDIHTIIGLIIMKLNRIYQLGITNAKTKDELQDSLNYLVFALEKYNKGEKNNQTIGIPSRTEYLSTTSSVLPLYIIRLGPLPYNSQSSGRQLASCPPTGA